MTVQIGNQFSTRAHFYFAFATSLIVANVPIEPATAVSPGPSSNSMSNETRLIAAENAAPEEPVLEDVMSKALTAYGGKPELAHVLEGSTMYGEQKALSESENPKSYKMSFKNDKWRLDLNDSTPAVD